MSELPLEISCQQVHSHATSNTAQLLLDCREPHEHAIAHLPEALLIPMQQIPTSLETLKAELDKTPDQPLIVYCHHGMRSAQTANWLRENGFPQAQSMAGGIDEWAVEITPEMPRY